MEVVQDLISREQIPVEDILELDLPEQLRPVQEVVNGALYNDELRRLPLEILLGFTADFQATVPEDKIYAVLGLAHHTTSPELKIQAVSGPAHKELQKRKVEYGESVKSTSAIIRNVARGVLLSDKSTLEHFHLARWGYRDFAAPMPSIK